MDQSSFAAPHGLSQRITSFFACACQGIHQMPLRHLIVLIANAHLSAAYAATPLPFTTERSKISSAYPFDDSPTGNTPSVSGLSSDQLLEIMSGDARSGNINHEDHQMRQAPNNHLHYQQVPTGTSRHVFSSQFQQNRQKIIDLLQTFTSSRTRNLTTHPTQTPKPFGGAERDRTADPLLAKQVLSQLSYSPI